MHYGTSRNPPDGTSMLVGNAEARVPAAESYRMHVPLRYLGTYLHWFTGLVWLQYGTVGL